ncbi:MAG: hypothetical protein K6G74_03005 [Bacilli bacterium]|nr:hypothetical protein [Bacilli bacterium]
MGLDKKLKKRIEQIDKNLDAIVKNPYEKVISEPVSEPAPKWARWVFPIGGAFLSASLALSIILPLALNNRHGPLDATSEDSVRQDGQTSTNKGPKGSQGGNPMMGGPNHYDHYESGTYTPENLNRLITPKHNEISRTPIEGTMSETTYDSYKAFTKKFVTLMMDTNNSDVEKSLAVSIPDAYLCLAITGIISDQNCLQDVLDYLELDNTQALKTAATQIASSLGSMMKDQFGNDVGGLNLNSIWLNPQKMALKEKDEALYSDLKDIFEASLYLEGLTSNRAKQFIAQNGLPDKPIPNIDLRRDDDPAPLSVMSTYYNIDVFGAEQEWYEDQFQDGGHTMNYTFGGKTKAVDYIGRRNNNSRIYENAAFYGATMNMSNSDISFFLPKNRTAMPSTILEDVLDEDYSPKVVTYTKDGQTMSTTSYDVDISAPYFFMDNKLRLDHTALSASFPHLTASGAGSLLATSLISENVFLSSIEQFSVMRFDYNGFYSCSATTATMEGAAPSNNVQELVLDHPYVFRTSKDITVGSSTRSVPTVIGEIVDPNYLV